MLENPLDAGWGLLLALRWVGFWLPTYLTSFFHKVERRFHTSNRTINHFIKKMGTFSLSPGSLGSSRTGRHRKCSSSSNQGMRATFLEAKENLSYLGEETVVKCVLIMQNCSPLGCEPFMVFSVGFFNLIFHNIINILV